MITPHEIPETHGSRSHPYLIGGLALGVPLASLVLIAIFAPLASVHLFGIRGSTLALFACAPLTSLCLFASNLLWGDHGDKTT